MIIGAGKMGESTFFSPESLMDQVMKSPLQDHNANEHSVGMAGGFAGFFGNSKVPQAYHPKVKSLNFGSLHQDNAVFEQEVLAVTE